MDLSESIDPENWHRIIGALLHDPHRRSSPLRGHHQPIHRRRIMALFGAPIAHEDHAQRACYAALHLGDGLRRYAQELKRERGLGFSSDPTPRTGLTSERLSPFFWGGTSRVSARGRCRGNKSARFHFFQPCREHIRRDTARGPLPVRWWATAFAEKAAFISLLLFWAARRRFQHGGRNHALVPCEPRIHRAAPGTRNRSSGT
jgi:hypothetical protein